MNEPKHPRPGDITKAAGPNTGGIYVRRATGTVTLNAFAGGEQFRFVLDAGQATALADQLTAETDGISIVHADAEVFLGQFDPTHFQEL